MIIVTNSDVLGKNLHYLRRKRWMSRRKLAALAGWKPSAVRAVELDLLRDVEHSVLRRLAALFELDIQTLLTQKLWE